MMFLGLQMEEETQCFAMKYYLLLNDKLEVTLMQDGVKMDAQVVQHIVTDGKIAMI